jgi:hypothetical protein
MCVCVCVCVCDDKLGGEGANLAHCVGLGGIKQLKSHQNDDADDGERKQEGPKKRKKKRRRWWATSCSEGNAGAKNQQTTHSNRGPGWMDGWVHAIVVVIFSSFLFGVRATAAAGWGPRDRDGDARARTHE